MNAHEEVEIQLYAFLTSILKEVNGHLHDPSNITMRRIPDIHRIVGGSIAGLDVT
jgi:hypothetical protein